MLDINNSAEATRLVGDLMKWTGERNIHLHTVLHLNKGDDNARGHIGTELNNKAECVLQVTKDSIDADRSVVAPAIIRSKPFDKFAFRLTEQADGICLPEVDATYVEATKTAKHFSYQELTDEQHREALKASFGEDITLSYGDLIPRLRAAYKSVTAHEYGQTKLKKLLRFLLHKRMVVKEERANIASIQSTITKLMKNRCRMR